MATAMLSPFELVAAVPKETRLVLFGAPDWGLRFSGRSGAAIATTWPISSSTSNRLSLQRKSIASVRFTGPIAANFTEDRGWSSALNGPQ